MIDKLRDMQGCGPQYYQILISRYLAPFNRDWLYLSEARTNRTRLIDKPDNDYGGGGAGGAGGWVVSWELRKHSKLNDGIC